MKFQNDFFYIQWCSISRYIKSFILLMFPVLILINVKCVSKDEKIKTAVSKPSKASNPVIKSFLFLNEGMTLDEVIRYLDSNKIKYKPPKSVLEYNLLQVMCDIMPMEKIIIYDYQLGDVTLDTAQILFIDKVLYCFIYEKNFELKDDFINKQDFFWQGFKQNDFFFNRFYTGLFKKYGAPQEFEDYYAAPIIVKSEKKMLTLNSWDESKPNLQTPNLTSVFFEAEWGLWWERSQSHTVVTVNKHYGQDLFSQKFSFRVYAQFLTDVPYNAIERNRGKVMQRVNEDYEKEIKEKKDFDEGL